MTAGAGVFAAGQPFGPADVERMIRAGGDRVVDDALDGRLVGSLDGADGDWCYGAMCELANRAAPMLGVPDIGTLAYGKVLEYPAGSSGIDWHHDYGTSLPPLGEAVLVAQGKMVP